MKKNPIHNISEFMFVNHKFYILIKMTFLKEFMLTRQGNSMNVIFVTVGIF